MSVRSWQGWDSTVDEDDDVEDVDVEIAAVGACSVGDGVGDGVGMSSATDDDVDDVDVEISVCNVQHVH